MAYTNFKNCTEQQYKTVIYSQDCRHKIKISFNNVELEDADIYCEKLTVSSRLLPTGAKRFSLDNLITKSATLILHDIDLSKVADPVNISIGTLVGDKYEYVPIGVFNIQDTPTTDQNKTTIKLRDNAVKLDVPYNAKPIIDTNGGSATKFQIFQNICETCGIETEVTSFINSNEPIGIYDNSIKARVYITYFAEQSGAIATFNREGKLIFIYLNNLVTQSIPLHYVEKYEDGTTYEISRTVYEDGVRKFVGGDETKDTLYLNTANPYISSEEHVKQIHELVKGFKINSFKTGKIIGDPSVDCYDLIKIQVGTVSYITFANYDMTYNGVIINNYDTQIGLEERKENVTVNSEESFRKYAKTEIDNLEGTIKLTAGNIETINNRLDETYTKGQTEQLIVDSITGLTNTFTQTGGSNLIKDSLGALNDGTWGEKVASIKDTYTLENSVAGQGIMLNGETIKQIIQVPNKAHTISFKYKRTVINAITTVKINDVSYELTSNDLTEFTQLINVANNVITIEFTSDTDNSCYILDLMLNLGEEKRVWEQNNNEAITDTVKIGKGIQVESSVTNTYWRADSDGSRVVNKTSGKVVSEYTDKGTVTEEFESKSTSKVNGVLFVKIGNHRWLSGV